MCKKITHVLFCFLASGIDSDPFPLRKVDQNEIFMGTLPNEEVYQTFSQLMSGKYLCGLWGCMWPSLTKQGLEDAVPDCRFDFCGAAA